MKVVVKQDKQGSAESQLSSQISHGPSTDLIQNTPEVPILDSNSVSVSSDKSRKISREDIEIVQNLVERCLQLYMDKDEVVNTLLHRARIDPGFTALVWQKLEEENKDFFTAYNARLMLKKQIMLFNQLLEQQYNLMKFPIPSKDLWTTMQNANTLDHADCEVNNISMGYPVVQYPPIPSGDHPGMDSVGNISTCLANGITASGDFHSTTVNSNDFASIDMSWSSLTASALDSTFSSHMTSSEALQMGPDARDSKQSLQPFVHQMPWNLSFSHSAADLTNVEVEEFFADNVPESDTQLEED